MSVRDTDRPLSNGVDHIGVCCVFFCHDGNGRLLLHKRSAKCRDEQGRWDCGGGAIEFGEDIEAAVRREVWEEFGVNPEEVTMVATTNVLRDNHGTATHWIALVHAVRVNPAQVKNCDCEKIEELKWFLPGEFPEPRHTMFDQHYDLVRHLIEGQ